MTFKSNMASDFDDVILNKTEFAEDIGYTKSGQAIKTITAIVDRDTHKKREMGPDGESRFRECNVKISADATNGILDPGEDDFVTLDTYPGSGSTLNWNVAEVIERDEHAQKLRVTRRKRTIRSDEDHILEEF